MSWVVAFLVVYWLVVREVEDTVAARDKLSSVIITLGAIALIVPLVSIIVFIVCEGPRRPLGDVLHADPGVRRPQVGGEGRRGALHSIVGTLEQVGIAVIISVPLALATAVFLNEIGGKGRRPVRMLVDAMSGVPSIVAGLFIFAVWVVGLHQGFSGFAGALALSILMLPTVTRTSEEVLRLVPDGLREAGLALGLAGVARHLEGGPADRPLGPRHRRHPRHRPGHRRDGAAASSRRTGTPC